MELAAQRSEKSNFWLGVSLDAVFDPVSILCPVQEAHPLEFQDETADGSIGGAAEIPLQLLCRELPSAIGGQYELPQVLFLLRHAARGQSRLKMLRCRSSRERIAQFVVDIFDEIHQEGRHIQDAADPGILFDERVCVIVSFPAPLNESGQRNKQSGGISALHQIPQVQQEAMELRVQRRLPRIA